MRLLSNNFKHFSIGGTIVVGAETGTGAYADTRKRGEVENYNKVSIWAKKKKTGCRNGHSTEKCQKVPKLATASLKYLWGNVPNYSFIFTGWEI